MIIIVGLGNPGKKFEGTRHNVGFMVLDKFAEKNDFPEFELQKKSEVLVSEGVVGEDKIVLVKPQTFMNDSGKAVKQIISNFKFQISNLLIVHDDIDLPVGKIKINKERGSAGHKGVESIIKNIGNDRLIRFRIGIKPQDTRYKIQDTKKLVLKKFTEDEQKIINETIEKAAESLDFFIKEGLDRTMNEYNK